MTGGVTEAVIRRLSEDKSTTELRSIAFNGVRGMQGTKEAVVPYGDRELKIAMVSGPKNAETLIQKIQKGEAQYDFVEVMACPGGCISGAGQPITNLQGKKLRSTGLYAADKMCSIKRSEENPVVMAVYSELLKGKVHELLHVDYKKEN